VTALVRLLDALAAALVLGVLWIWATVPQLGLPALGAETHGSVPPPAPRALHALLEALVPDGGPFPEGASTPPMAEAVEAFARRAGGAAVLRLFLGLLELSPFLVPPIWLRRFSRLPDTEALADIAYWSVLVGFPLLTLGIALGAYWASSAWGRYWGWDPKETSALLTWFIYAGYLHARGLRGWEGKRAAWLLVVGFAAVLFTYFAVNFLISGLHSYAGV